MPKTHSIRSKKHIQSQISQSILDASTMACSGLSTKSTQQLLIYRVEHMENSYGPYRNCNNALRKVIRGKNLLEHQKAPNEDSTLARFFSHRENDYPFWPSEWFFGFPSEDHVYSWFSNFRQVKCLKKQGFIIRLYSVPKKYVRTSNWQSLFRLDKASKIGIIPLATKTLYICSRPY